MRSMAAKSVRLVQLTTLSVEDQLRVMAIRNEAEVRRWMYTDHVIDASEHMAWIGSLKRDPSRMVFAVLDSRRQPIGVVSASSIDTVHLKADWAYYLTHNARGGLGSALEFSFVSFVFDSLGMSKLNCEVIEGNSAVLKMHRKFLFQCEGMRRAQIVKMGARVGVHLLGLTREEWHAGKDDVYRAYGRVLDKFSVSIEWKKRDSSEVASPIDEIEWARARNNLNWMNVLRLALEKSPVAAGAIVSDIRTLDRQIGNLTDKLIDELTPRE